MHKATWHHLMPDSTLVDLTYFLFLLQDCWVWIWVTTSWLTWTWSHWSPWLSSDTSLCPTTKCPIYQVTAGGSSPSSPPSTYLTTPSECWPRRVSMACQDCSTWWFMICQIWSVLMRTLWLSSPTSQTSPFKVGLKLRNSSFVSAQSYPASPLSRHSRQRFLNLLTSSQTNCLEPLDPSWRRLRSQDHWELWPWKPSREWRIIMNCYWLSGMMRINFS